MILDIFSRYVVGWTVAPTESAKLAKLAKDLIADAVAAQRVEPGALTVHVDRGQLDDVEPGRRAARVPRLGRTHSRQHVSNDCEYHSIAFGPGLTL